MLLMILVLVFNMIYLKLQMSCTIVGTFAPAAEWVLMGTGRLRWWEVISLLLVQFLGPQLRECVSWMSTSDSWSCCLRVVGVRWTYSMLGR